VEYLVADACEPVAHGLVGKQRSIIDGGRRMLAFSAPEMSKNVLCMQVISEQEDELHASDFA
jgi:hypothetical protein